MSKKSGIVLIDRALDQLKRKAIVDKTGTYSYNSLLEDSQKMASHLLLKKQSKTNPKTLNGERIAFLIPSSYAYVVTQWGIWQAGGIAVPLCTTHPVKEWAYVIKDTACKRIVVHPSLMDKIRPLLDECSVKLLDFAACLETSIIGLPKIDEKSKALIIYTSGTTGKPKGVVTTHANIKAQIKSLVRAWDWQKNDYILNVLPMHHVHGIVNILCCALWQGASCQLMDRFDAEAVWQAFKEDGLNLFMAVPTVYHKLIQSFDAATKEEQAIRDQAFKKFRLMVSGSAALPVSVLERWEEISGHILLERYGMTEIGMALSNSYRKKRIPGHVGYPFPKVKTKIVDEDGKEVENGTQGELLIKGPTVFLEYWNNPVATKEAFDDGWFKTGDIVLKNRKGVYKILGRNSVDILKTGGHKISALEIEEVLRTHPSILECAVVGLPSKEWGQVVTVALVATKDLPDEKALKKWTKGFLAKYKVPSRWIVVKELPKNAMGKIMKKEVIKLITNS